MLGYNLFLFSRVWTATVSIPLSVTALREWYKSFAIFFLPFSTAWQKYFLPQQNVNPHHKLQMSCS